MSIRAPAKLNLFLEVLERRTDGFHNIASILQEIALVDRIALRRIPGGEIRVRCATEAVPVDGRNLMVVAARRVQEETGTAWGVEMELEKHIPMGAGLGGGSSDAAAVLQALPGLWGMECRFEQRLAWAAAIGSDVPFFLHGGTCLCEGRGDRVRPLPCKGELEFVLAMPPWGIATAAAYGALEPEDFGCESADTLCEALAAGDGRAVGGALFNRFERPVCAMEPREAEVLAAARGAGFAAVCMSGSGSTVYGLVPPGGDGRALAEAVKGRCPYPIQTLCARTHRRGVHGRSAAGIA